ncbi:MAG: hypothetical protein WBO46_14705, partial [Caldilineaceae bacterium]
LEAYWDAYEAIELNTYADYRYLTAVWRYHEQIAEAIGQGALAEARQLHVAHMQLLGSRGAPFDNAIATPLPDGTILAAGE